MIILIDLTSHPKILGEPCVNVFSISQQIHWHNQKFKHNDKAYKINHLLSRFIFLFAGEQLIQNKSVTRFSNCSPRNCFRLSDLVCNR